MNSQMKSYVMAALAIGLAGAVIYLSIIGQTVPEVLVAGLSAILGFFFHDVANANAVERMRKQ